MFTLKVTILCFISLLHLLPILFAEKSILISLTNLPLSFPLHILTICHRDPTSQDSMSQMAEEQISASPRVDTRQDLVGRLTFLTRQLISGSRAWLSTDTPILSCQRPFELSDFGLGTLW